MRNPSRKFRAIRLANAVLFITAVGLGLDQSMASSLSRFSKDPHWSTTVRALQVVDITGDTTWHRANQRAVDAWNQAATGTDLRLTWMAGTGPCEPEPGRIVVCGASSEALDDDAGLSRQGVALLELGPDRNHAHIGVATVIECADCLLRATRRAVVATHELGHALGLPHSRRPGSVMYHTGGPDTPDEGDVRNLRTLYAHADDPDRCGYFDARFGLFCF